MMSWILKHMPTETPIDRADAHDYLVRCLEAPACLQVDELRRIAELSGPIDETGEVLA
jgi:hypothetical protein